MLASLIIVFREVLEAGLVVGIVLAATKGVPGRSLWTGSGIAGGLISACIVAAFADTLFSAFTGSGQELFNAAVLGMAALMLCWHNVWMSRHARVMIQDIRAVGRAVSVGERPLYAITIVTAVAVAREGAEVVLFLYGIAASGGGSAALLAGSILGIAAGGVVATLLYFGLLRVPTRHLFTVTSWMLTLLAAGMASQSVGYLSKAGLLPAPIDPVWDSSGILPDDSLMGIALRTLVGYTDRPSELQVFAYALMLVTIVVLMRLFRSPPPMPRAAE